MSDIKIPTVIVNPASQGGATRRRWPAIEATLRKELGEFTTAFTERAGHATELARAALHNGSKLVIAMGGDGTFNEVANGFFESEQGVHDDVPIAPDAAMGVLPMGTGGDFIKTTGTPKDLAEAARAIVAATPRAIDVGRLDFTTHEGKTARRYFINITSFGISGVVDRYVNNSSKLLGGSATFYLASVRASFNYRNARCRITLDSGPAIERAVYVVAVSNGRFFGGGMKIAPGAELDDGRFDVVTIGDVGMFTMLRHTGKLYTGAHLALPFVRVERARTLDADPVDPKDEVLLDVDGEQPGRLPARFRVLPGALQLRA